MSSLPWFRFYSEAVDDEKLRLLAFEDRWHFVALCCLKCSGVIDCEGALRDRKISIKLGLSLSELDTVKKRLFEVGLIDDNFQPVSWEKRQFKSDTSKNRVAKYRESKKKKECNGSVTLQKRKCNVLDTDLDTEKPTIPYSEIVQELNTRAGKKFKATTDKTKTCIHARWEEGFRFDDFKAVIRKKTKKWGSDPKMADYLRPETLFGTKFESYLNEPETVDLSNHKNWGQ